MQVPGREGLFYPVDLDRINGKENPNDISSCRSYFSSSRFIFPMEATDPETQAVTVTFAPRVASNYKKQIKCTGSDTIWSDITLGSALTSVNDGKSVTFAQ